MSEPIKCAAKDFTKVQFYLVQTNGGNKRYVAAFQNAENIARFLSFFAGKARKYLQLKIRDHQDSEDPQEYAGQVRTKYFLLALDRYRNLILHDGYHELMIRLPKTGEYIAFDEHGLLFIYTTEDYSKTLGEFGLEYRPDEKLIYEYNHWHIRTANGAENLQRLITELGLERMYN